MPIFRSQHQAALLAWLLLHPEHEYTLTEHEYTLTELAKILDVPLTTLQREAQRLVGAGILADRTLGRARLLRANLSNRGAVHSPGFLRSPSDRRRSLVKSST
jgi:DNA-binding MarR family transcriptional regulator